MTNRVGEQAPTEVVDARLSRIETSLNEVKVQMLGVATKDAIWNWGVTLMITVVATGMAVVLLMLS